MKRGSRIRFYRKLAPAGGLCLAFCLRTREAMFGLSKDTDTTRASPQLMYHKRTVVATDQKKPREILLSSSSPLTFSSFAHLAQLLLDDATK